MAPTFVIVGAGLAGQRAAETLRAEGHEGRIVLLGEEPERPYDRPPLSKEVLQAKEDVDVFLRPAAWYAEQEVELRTGVRARALDPERHVLTLSGDERVTYDRLLCATGCHARPLPVPGADLAGIHYLRTLADARRLDEAARRAGRLVVVGAGFIGAEVAASCRSRRLDVAMVELAPTPLAYALGEEIGAFCAQIHRDHGVELLTGEGVTAFEGTDRVERVVTTSGRRLDCDLAVVGIGVVPATGWLEGSGVRLQDGVVVDERCATNVPDVFAAGDVARWPYRGTGDLLRVEHWDNAGNQAAVAARAMLGKGEPYDPVPYFWSDQYDLRLQYVGFARSWDRIVYRGRREAGGFSAFFLTGGRVAACLSVNRPRDMMAARRLVRARTAVAAERLADEDTDLRRLV